MLATSVIIVVINWEKYILCQNPRHIWIVVDYTTVFVFRLLMFVDNGLAAGLALAQIHSLFHEVVCLSDAIEDEGKCIENLVRGISAGNIFDLGPAQPQNSFNLKTISFSSQADSVIPQTLLSALKGKWGNPRRIDCCFNPVDDSIQFM